MFRLCVANIFLLLIYQLESRITSQICQIKPTEKHCLIEYMARDRWPHQKRWAFDWRRQHCYEIRWADHCGDVKENTNNFDTEKKCLDRCSGWA